MKSVLLNSGAYLWTSVKERVAKQKPLDKISLRRLIETALERFRRCQRSCKDFFGIRIALLQYEHTVFIAW